ncbi:uncharacterized protein wu:fc17b08 isoform X2 [Melanotaenia boesemani]|nr:uncharacterized protein wu:fc17b08 isoform X2 [Melanotaenia boesemani]
MISQFAAEYTSKTISPQDSHSDSPPHSDQSLPTPPLYSGAPPPSTSPAATLTGPAHNQNPVLSKLLMADQDAPLDLTIKKPLAEPSEQDGVLDLSIKKNRYSSSQSVHSPCASPAASTLKGESPDFHVTKAKDLQSTSTLEQFMAKLCPHHQRQIVDAIGFLQSEVKAHSSSNAQKASNSTSGVQGSACATASSSEVTPQKLGPELSSPSQSTPKTEVQEMSHSITSSCAIKKTPEHALSLKTSGPELDHCSPGPGSNHPPASPTANPVDGELNRHNDHAPLKMKIMTNNGTGKKLSCVLNTTLSSQADTLEDKQDNLHSFSKAETQSARLSSSVKRYSQLSLAHQARRRETLGHPKDTSAKVFPVHITIPSNSARTARKTIRSSEHRMRHSSCRQMVDPDLGRCDIVFIDKPITECLKEQRRSVLPRRNARKSTRGHMYSDEIWELKTVRTLAGRGNCPNPMPELITLITPKQILSKPEGVPPVHMPFAGACREKINQQMSNEESDESVLPGAGDVVEVAASKVDIVVETSQTDQCQNKEQSDSPSPLRCTTENQEKEATVESGVRRESEDAVGEPTTEALKENEPESQEVTHNRTEQTDAGAETEAEQFLSITTEKAVPQLSSDKVQACEPVYQETSSPTASQVEEEEEDKGEKMQYEEPKELQPEMQKNSDNIQVTENLSTAGTAEELIVTEVDVIMSETTDSVEPLETENKDESNLSSKSLDPLSKKLPPKSQQRRKKGTKPSLPKSLVQTESVIVGYVNGKPVSASDRNLRHRAGSNPTSPSGTPVKSSQNTPEKTSADPTVDSDVENKKLEKTPPETNKPVKLLETTPVIHETEPSSDAPSSPGNKFPSRTKQTHKQKSVVKGQESLPALADQTSESKRQLRSTSQKTLGTSASNILTSISPPDPSTLILPSAEQIPALLPFPPPITSSLLFRSSDPPESKQSQQSTAPETVESDIEIAQPAEATSKDIQKNELEKESETKQKKLRSAKVVSDNNKSEKHKLFGEVSNPENQIPVKTEMQTQPMPLRSKRVPQKENEASDDLIQKKSVAYLEDRSVSHDDSSSSTSDRPTRMPLRSETSKLDLSHQSASQSPLSSKKLALRSQRSAPLSTSTVTETARQNDVRIMPERITKAQVKHPSVSVTSVPHSSHVAVIAPKHEPPKQMPNKFFETLTGEESQHLITNLNIKFDKMQKGWVQMDKEGQPTAKYRNKSDRQAAIWKSKRRARKPKSSEQQKYSPVQMLFMKGFNLSSICRWFLESTETKSLVIVKKVNTRLPSETQLCFHSSSGASGTSQGVFPSLQAERLKKHLKKFAIASPVKSNPKSQKLIAKALEQEASTVRGKEKAELPSNTQTVTKSYSSAKASAQTGESQKSSGKSKNPASARILRKYSNIREKMQVQQTTVRLKGGSKMLKNKKMKKPLAATKSAAKSNLKPSLKGRKSAVAVSKRMKESAAKLQKRKMLAGKKMKKHYVQERAVKAQVSSRASREMSRKDLPKRCSQRLGSPKVSEHNPVDTPKNKVNNKKEKEADKGDMEKCTPTKMNSTVIQTKESSESPVAEVKGSEKAAETPQPSVDVKAPAPTDQVLTRSQKKMEAGASLAGSSSSVSKRATKSTASPKRVKKADERTLTRSGASKRHQTALLPRSATKAAATKRAQELLETPAKRTRTK